MSNPTISSDSSNVNISNADLIISQDLYCNKVYNSNYVSSESDLPSASNYHGMTMHVHGTGALYYAHAGTWRKLITDTSGGSVSSYTDPLSSVAYSGNFSDLTGAPTLQQVSDAGSATTGDITANAFFDSNGILVTGGGGGSTTSNLHTILENGNITSNSITASFFIGDGGLLSNISGGGGGSTNTTPTQVFPSGGAFTLNMASSSYKTFTANIDQDIDTLTIQNHTAGSQGLLYLTSNSSENITINGKTSGLGGTGVVIGFDDLVLEDTNKAVISFTSDGSNVFTNAVKYPSGTISGVPTLQQVTTSDNSTTNRVILQGGLVTGNVATTSEVIDGVLSIDLGSLSYKTFTCNTTNSISNISVTGDITGTQGIIFLNAADNITVNGTTSGLAGANVNVSFSDMEVSAGEKALLVFTSDGTNRYFNAVKYPSTSAGSPSSNLDQVVTQGNVTSNTLTVGGLTSTANVDAVNSYVSGTVTASSFVGDGSGLTGISVERYNAYDGTGGAFLSTTVYQMRYTDERINTNSSIFQKTGGVITINKTATFHITTYLTTDVSNTTRSITQFVLKIDTGSGWISVPGTTGYIYNRISSEGEGTASISCILDITSGDRLSFMVFEHSGTNVYTKGNGSGITIVELL